MPRGFMSSQERDPRNFTLAQWQQAKRIGKDPRQIKKALQDCWAISDTQGAFQQALKEQGYTLARGDRRGFVALDHRCEVFSISKKWVGVSAKDVHARLEKPEGLPSVDEARVQIAGEMVTCFSTLQKQQERVINARLTEIEHKRVQMVRTHRIERRDLEQAQQVRQEIETRTRQARYNKGLRGLLDRFTGRRRKIKEQNECDAFQAQQRDRQERDQLIFYQLAKRRTLQARIERLQVFNKNQVNELSRDIDQYQDIQWRRSDIFKSEYRQPKRGPELSR